MWAYIMAAARGERRASPPRRNTSATLGPASDFFRSYRFPLRGGPGGGLPPLHRLPRVASISGSLEMGGSTAPHRDKPAPIEMSAIGNSSAIEDKERNMVYAEEGHVNADDPESPWRVRVSRWARERWRACIRAVRQRARGTSNTRAPPRSPDWFLDKFAAGTPPTPADLDLPGETAYAGEPSRWLCGARLCFDPSLLIHYRWLALVSLTVLYNIIFVIGRAVFWELNNVTPVLWWILDYTGDVIYIFDIFVHAHEGYLDQGLLVRDSKKLRSYYFKSGKWQCDLLSILPTDIVYSWWPPSECQVRVPCPVIVRMNRLARLPRLWEWFERTETATGYPNAFRICKVVLAILILIHWNACFYFGISYGIGFGTDNWVYNLNGTRNSSLARQYIYSFYWSTLTLTTIGETPQPENDAEYLFVVADFLAGVLIFATIVGNIGSMISNMNVARVDFQNRMDGVKQYMAFRKVGGELEARVIRWFAYTWQQSGALDEEHVLSALPDKLKAEIAIRVHLDTLRQVRIFQDCEPGLLEALVLKLRLQVFSPGDYICRKGDVGKEMYIVKRGRLQVVGDDGKTILATLSAGSVFGEVSVLEIAGNRTGNRRTANVRSLGYSDLFCLAKRDLWEALADYPEARISLTERGCQLLRKDGLLDESVYSGAQSNQRSLEITVDRLEATIEALSERLAHLLADFATYQNKFKQRIARLEARQNRLNQSSDLQLNLLPRQIIEPALVHAVDTSTNCIGSAPPRHRTQSFSVTKSDLNSICEPPQPKSFSFRHKTNHY